MRSSKNPGFGGWFWKPLYNYPHIVDRRRPKAIVVVAGFLFVAAGIAALVGCSLVFVGKLVAWLSQFNRSGMAAFQSAGTTSGVLLLILAVVLAVAGTGLLRQRKWAWWISVSLFVMNGCGDLANLVLRGDAVRGVSGVVICSAFLYALVRHGTRSYFKAPGIH